MVVVFWFLLAVAVGVLASNRGRSGVGWFLLSVVLSPLLGFIFVLVAKNLAAPVGVPQESGATHVRCSECAEWVLPEATTCKHCGAKLVPDLDFHRRQAVVRENLKTEESKNLLIGLLVVAGLIGLVALVSS